MSNFAAHSVYVVASEIGAVKVGRTGKPRERLDQLLIASPVPLSLAYVGECDREVAKKIEARAHDLLGKHWKRGEWFDVAAADAVKAVLQAAFDLGYEIKERVVEKPHSLKWWDRLPDERPVLRQRFSAPAIGSRLHTSREVVRALGGPTRVAALVRTSVRAASNWSCRNSFPSSTYVLITCELERIGYSAAISLWGMIEPIDRADNTKSAT